VITVAFIGILVMAGMFSEKHHYRWDLTKNKTHSIALQTRQLLEKLDGDTLDLQTYVFYRGEDGLREKRSLSDLLDAFGYHSEHFKYELIDIDRNPLLAMQLGITSTSALIMTYGERQEKVYSEQEAKLTQAMANLLGGDAPGRAGTIFFLTGHGEPSLETSESYSLSEAVSSIEEKVGPVGELVLAGGQAVPDSCEILIVAGPQTELLPAELTAISNYIGNGGNVLFMVEPFMADSLAAWLGQYGARVGDDVVIDMLKGAPGTPFAFLADDYPEHEITRFFEVGTVFDMARSVDRSENPPMGAEISVLARSSEKSLAADDENELQTSFGAVAQRALDEGEPVPLGVAITLAGASGEAADSASADSTHTAHKGSRLVVFGDRHLFVDGYLGQLGNRDLLLNTLRWLGGQADQITIEPKETENTPLNLVEGQLMMIGLVSVLGLPLAVILVGIFVWVRRRSKR
jgi:ABC-type uncharacterized transport system involved in gliding motility auxiliary subunit